MTTLSNILLCFIVTLLVTMLAWFLPLRRIILSAAVIGYVGFSIYHLPRYEARLQNQPFVQALAHAEDRVRDVQRRAAGLVQIPIIGRDLARAAQNTLPREVTATVETAMAIRFFSQFSPKALIGVSFFIWVKLVWMMLHHLWLTDAGSVRFAHKMLRPTIFGRPTPGAQK